MRGRGDLGREDGFGDAYRTFYDLDLGQAAHFLTVDGEELFAQVFEPGGSVQGSAVVVHGYYDHAGIYGHLIRFLLGRGLRVVVYDQIGHGLSSGARATIESFDRYRHSLEAVVDRFATALARPRLLIGQSMGGSVVMDYLTRHPGIFDDAVLLAPLVRPARWPSSRLVYYAARPFIDSVPRGWNRNSSDPAFPEFLKTDPLQHDRLPVQWVTAMVEWRRRFERSEFVEGVRPRVIQGGNDLTVDARYNLSVIRSIFDVEVMEIPEAGHHLVNETESIRDRMWRFLDSEL